ncbi:MAG TPA: hypothetical protein VFM42_05105 [Sphingomicrobium sp.]|nr:hypothetical protein [Sphingomicrobium sp.]
MIRNIAFFIALMATALALGGALAHALELPNKIGLPADQYFTVQQAYSGWNRLSLLLLVELLSMIALAWLYWGEPRVRWPVLASIGCLVVAQIIFWSFTFPANQRTSNWTAIPDDWEHLRRSWEFSHAAGAAFQCLALAALIVAVLSRRSPSE